MLHVQIPNVFNRSLSFLPQMPLKVFKTETPYFEQDHLSFQVTIKNVQDEPDFSETSQFIDSLGSPNYLL